jgi:hypothetical protein
MDPDQEYRACVERVIIGMTVNHARSFQIGQQLRIHDLKGRVIEDVGEVSETGSAVPYRNEQVFPSNQNSTNSRALALKSRQMYYAKILQSIIH